ncbi:hypothetical protein ABH973_000126 [Bradyrhizobium ottawaense]|uniref:hypothetical protein n=1 Tax=Bradyrhizobium ottawaense TaxID=931866 RepID=UPI0035110B08
MDEFQWVVLDDPEPNERDRLFKEAHERFTEKVKRTDEMILGVVKAQITVERFMIELLEAYGKDPKRYFFTSDKIKECKRLDPAEVGQPMWQLLTLCSWVRNELAHSLDDKEIQIRCDAAREAYLALTENELQKQSIRDMNDTQMVTSALYSCGSHIVVATDAKVAADKKARTATSA